jgi:hypothetical protein
MLGLPAQVVILSEAKDLTDAQHLDYRPQDPRQTRAG